MVLKLTFLMFRDRGTTFDIPCRGLGTNVLLRGILRQKVSWKNMADSESQPSEPAKKKMRFLPAWLKEFTWLRCL